MKCSIKSFNNQHQYWVIVPAAGIGQRMITAQPQERNAHLRPNFHEKVGSKCSHTDVCCAFSPTFSRKFGAQLDVLPNEVRGPELLQRIGKQLPKQYLSLGDVTVIERTLHCLASHPLLQKIVVVLCPDDVFWSTLSISQHQKIIVTSGGDNRCRSVFNGLKTLSTIAQPSDWVLVHDAVRPYLQHSDIDRLIDMLSDHPVGGLLGIPVANTLKRIDTDYHVVTTVERQDVWQALTPQMFRFDILYQAIKEVLDQSYSITDEASAIELLGKKPKMVLGSSRNIKITYPEDLNF